MDTQSSADTFQEREQLEEQNTENQLEQKPPSPVRTSSHGARCPSTYPHTRGLVFQPQSSLQLIQPQPTSDSNLT